MEGTIQFPPVLDSTLVNDWRSCNRKGFFSGFRKLKPKGISIDLHAGGAFARGLEATRRAFYEHGQPANQAVEFGVFALLREYGYPQHNKPDTNKTFDRMAGALVAYFDQYPLGSDYLQPALIAGKPAIEFSFAIPLDEWGLFHPETNDPLIFAGRADMVAQYKNSFYIEDEKTCSQLGESWGKKWELRAQFMAYNWAALRMGVDVAGTIVRGICILKNDTKFAEALVRRNDLLLARWEAQTKRDITSMLNHYRWLRDSDFTATDIFNYSLGDACESYSGCPYRELCLARDIEPYIAADYEENTWNPLTRT